MKLNHSSLAVTDVLATSQFLKKYFGMRNMDDGFDIEPPQRLHTWTFYVQTPGGFMVEVLC